MDADRDARSVMESMTIVNAEIEAAAIAHIVQQVDVKLDDSGHPVREWIDTLLLAAKSQKKNEGISTLMTTGNLEGDEIDLLNRTKMSPMRTATKESGVGILVSNAQVDTVKPETESKLYHRRRCGVEGCDKFARFNNVCCGHGGRRLCSDVDCKRVAQFGHKCSTHGGIKHCNVEGCKRAVQSRGFCKTHGGGVRCKTPGCDKGAISKGHCRSHGGGSRCAEPGCQKWSQRHGFCVRHSKAMTLTPDGGKVLEPTIEGEEVNV